MAKVFFCISVSQTGGILSSLIIITWNYNMRFKTLIDCYNVMSVYVCIKSIISSQHASMISLAILGTAFVL